MPIGRTLPITLATLVGRGLGPKVGGRDLLKLERLEPLRLLLCPLSVRNDRPGIPVPDLDVVFNRDLVVRIGRELWRLARNWFLSSVLCRCSTAQDGLRLASGIITNMVASLQGTVVLMDIL